MISTILKIKEASSTDNYISVLAVFKFYAVSMSFADASVSAHLRHISSFDPSGVVCEATPAVMPHSMPSDDLGHCQCSY